MTLLETIAGFVGDIGTVGAPEPVRAQGKAHLLDSLGMMLAARAHPLTLRAASVALPGADATLAFTAAVACEALGLDDFDEGTRMHPGAVVVAALLGAAATSPTAVKGSDLLAAVVTGYEVTCRFGELVAARSLHDRGFHPTAVCGALGSAAAVATLRGASTGDAVGLAASLSAGVYELDGVGAIKGLQTGWAAHSGLAAVRFAAAGYEPAPQVLEGPGGLLRILGVPPPSAAAMIAALTGPSRIERVSFKPYSHFTDLHPATAALLEVLHDGGADVDDITAIDVKLQAGRAARLNRDYPPASSRLARRCPKFALAAVACRADRSIVADPLVTTFDGSALHDADILALAERVRWTDDLPADGPAASVTVHRTGATAVTRTATGYPGDGRQDETRWGFDEVAQRFRALVPRQDHPVIDGIRGLEARDDVRPMVARVAAALDGRWHSPEPATT